MTYTQSIVPKETSWVWICVASFLRWVSQEHADTQITQNGRKYDAEGNVKPQEKDWRTSEKAISAIIFRQMRNEVANDPVYKSMREEWRTQRINRYCA